MNRIEFSPRPLALTSRRVWRPFIGGRELDRLAGLANPRDGHFSEEWLLSTVPANNPGRNDSASGLTCIAGEEAAGEGKLSLAELLESNPAAFLGPAHAARFGANPGLLVKLIDSRDRLRLQVHPDPTAARDLFQTEFGKTESWHVLGLRDDGAEAPRLYLGFREGITAERWKEAFFRQDRDEMFSLLHSFRPEVGETYFIPGGLPHAIGAGCLIAEVQEPSDLTVRLERTVPGGPTLSDAAMHQGLGFERMFECFHYEGRSEAATLAAYRVHPKVISENTDYKVECLVGGETTASFGLERLDIVKEMTLAAAGVFSGLYVVEGLAAIKYGDFELAAGCHGQFFLPPLGGPVVVVNRGGGKVRVLRD